MRINFEFDIVVPSHFNLLEACQAINNEPDVYLSGSRLIDQTDITPLRCGKYKAKAIELGRCETISYEDAYAVALSDGIVIGLQATPFLYNARNMIPACEKWISVFGTSNTVREEMTGCIGRYADGKFCATLDYVPTNLSGLCGDMFLVVS